MAGGTWDKLDKVFEDRVARALSRLGVHTQTDVERLSARMRGGAEGLRGHPNPTHFALALEYERGMNAPVCVAKGVDLIARKIRDVAREHDVPAVENPPLARTLHGTVEVDQEIPPEHYRAVAEIIGYVMRLRRAVGAAQTL